ncbi:hypothetical protein AeNC1_019405, partial [Aphanomyces euteiches]
AISDFGLSRTAVSLENTKTGAKRSGTLNWMSPEQYFKSHSVTAQSDIWSFGMTLWEILCDDIPYKDYGPYEIPEAIQSEDQRPEKPGDLKLHLEPLRCAGKSIRQSDHLQLSCLKQGTERTLYFLYVLGSIESYRIQAV